MLVREFCSCFIHVPEFVGSGHRAS
jgi:hypothetical protein